MAHVSEKDSVTGVDTTGHEWDGIKELDNPLPRWWLWVFYACIVWSVGYWVLMPAWPLVSSYTRGVLGHSQREILIEEIAAAKAGQAQWLSRIEAATVDEIRTDPQLLEFALAGGDLTSSVGKPARIAKSLCNNAAPASGRTSAVLPMLSSSRDICDTATGDVNSTASILVSIPSSAGAAAFATTGLDVNGTACIAGSTKLTHPSSADPLASSLALRPSGPIAAL